MAAARKTAFTTLLISVLLPLQAAAIEYTNAINENSWRTISSVQECRLEQRVPFFGEVVFRTRAGEASGTYLRARSPRFQAGEAKLIARSPIWLPESREEFLGTVPVKRGTRPLWLGSETTELILAQLASGKEVELVKESWYLPEPSEPIKLAITNIGFRPEYRKYLRCLSGLLPANYDQMKRTALYFPPGDTDELSAAMTRKLDRMLKLVKYNKTIRQFYIDGHTDSLGDRAENLELSKSRAELVQQYLTRRGIPADWITLRWHGERYPVASNGSPAGRAKNRRVTVRMEKVEEIEVLPIASSE